MIAKTERRTFIYLDEVCFTKSSVKQRSWSKKNSNLTIDNEDIYVGYRAALASITEDRGILLVRIQPNAVNGEDFKSYL